MSANSIAQPKASNADSIVQIGKAFLSSPESARPWVYWFWVNSNLTRVGITADLEAMKRVGIGGVLIMDVSQGSPSGSIRYMDKQWQEMARFAIQEAARLGLEINMNNDAGWNGSGDPWVDPEFAMQTVVSTESLVVGGGKVDVVLPQSPANGGYYRDIAVIAVQDPDRVARMMDAKPSLIVSTGHGVVSRAFPSWQNPLELPILSNIDPPSIDIRFQSPFTACVLDLTATGLEGGFEASLQVSTDGQEFKPVKTFVLRNGKNSVTFDLINASCFRIKLLNPTCSSVVKKC